ncbi:hypothetical protein CYMTET_29578 [Cymbomonas tetramitiformis]|uniref:Uncharacterized protein n=1 Tax=Cymbomonas tetramitiformis TaxID=36881 RepID=A0AAE0FKP8_9CHLO|nr:hypothetical protein CYMTET_29578 [Cymbomonas tetramitiformis]
MWPGHQKEAQATVSAVLAYVSVLPTWGLSGSARRWFDFFINGKDFMGNERIMHHYAGALNSIPLLDMYQRAPQRLHLLRAGIAGVMGSLTNIREDGAPSMGWHGHPARLHRDPYSGDYGQGFYGHWHGAASYLHCHDELGWLCFYCDLEDASPSQSFQQPLPPLADTNGAEGSMCASALEPKVHVIPRDAFRRKIYIAPLRLRVAVAGGAAIQWFQVEEDSKLAPHIRIFLKNEADTGSAREAPLTLETPGGTGGYGRWRLECTSVSTWVCIQRETNTEIPGQYRIPMQGTDQGTEVKMYWDSNNVFKVVAMTHH